MLRLLLFIIILGILSSCRSTTTLASDRSSSKIEIIAKNLSEDGSFLSTKNDELNLFILNELDGHVETVFQKAAIFNHPSEIQSYDFQQIDLNNNYIIVLVEMDSHHTMDVVRLSVENNYLKLIEYHNRYDLLAIEEVLGDDDLLGIRRADSTKGTVTFKGSHRGDYYHYVINY